MLKKKYIYKIQNFRKPKNGSLPQIFFALKNSIFQCLLRPTSTYWGVFFFWKLGPPVHDRKGELT